jgi:hypothetical protein
MRNYVSFFISNLQFAFFVWAEFLGSSDDRMIIKTMKAGRGDLQLNVGSEPRWWPVTPQTDSAVYQKRLVSNLRSSAWKVLPICHKVTSAKCFDVEI